MPMVFNGAASNPLPARINNGAASGDTTLVAAAAGKSVRVYALRLNAAAACVVQIKDGAGTILEVFNFASAGLQTLFMRELPYYATTAGNALVMNVATAVQVDGVVETSTGI